MNDDRSLKDFFIQELQCIKNEYNDFCRDICLSKYDARTIKEVFKQLSLKLDDIQNVANRNLQVDINIMDELNQTKIHVTGCTEINDQYSEPNIEVVFGMAKEKRSFLDSAFNIYLAFALFTVAMADIMFLLKTSCSCLYISLYCS